MLDGGIPGRIVLEVIQRNRFRRAAGFVGQGVLCGVVGAVLTYVILRSASFADFTSALAALIAAVTLGSVAVQIYLARRVLKVALLEFKTVRDDLKFSRAQVAYINRRAILTLFHNEHRVPYIAFSVSGHDAKTEIPLRLWLMNDGNKTARDALVKLWFPNSWSAPGWNGFQDGNPEPFFTRQGLRYVANVPLNGKRYWHATIDEPFPLYPKVPRLVLDFRMTIPTGTQDRILWRVVCDDGTYPEEEAEGRLRVGVILKGSKHVGDP